MANPRISARRGQIVDLDVSFFRNGVLTDPFAIRRVDIFKTQVLPHNLVASLPFLDPDHTLYPSPATQVSTGKFVLSFDVPNDFVVPDVYFDVWYYFADDPCEVTGGTGTGTGTSTGGTSGLCDLDDESLQDQLLACCHRFWLYPDGWACGDDLCSMQFGFEPLNINFYKPEVKPLEISIMPLPLYDADFNRVSAVLPFITATISIETRSCELLVDSAPLSIGLRCGSFRTNPFVFKYMLTTNDFLRGTYRYQITLTLPDGTTRTSKFFILTIS